jgi:hypothetical protein
MAEMTRMVALAPLFYMGDHAKGAVFSLPSELVETYERLKLAVRTEAAAESPAASVAEVTSKMWDLDVTPAEYLSKWPEGPNAALALSILEAEAEAAESSDPAAASSPLISTQSLSQE